jgi:DNA-binding transcriptional MerR regulator
MMKGSGYTIQTMAARCGMTAHTLRYYERVGLIQPVWRGQNGHRRYSDQDEKWLNFLKSMRATHMPIREMQRYAALRESGFDRADEKSKILEDHRAVLEEQIVTLQKAHALLTHNIEDLRKIEETQADSVSEPLSQWNSGAIAAST